MFELLKEKIGSLTFEDVISVFRETGVGISRECSNCQQIPILNDIVAALDEWIDRLTTIFDVYGESLQRWAPTAIEGADNIIERFTHLTDGFYSRCKRYFKNI